MAGENKLELVVEVDVSKGNASLKSMNSGFSSMEQAAVQAARGASSGMDMVAASMAKAAVAGNLFADVIKDAIEWERRWTVEAAQYAAYTGKMGASMAALAKAHGELPGVAQSAVMAIKAVGLSLLDVARIARVEPEIVAGWEYGETSPSPRQLAFIARATGVPVEAFSGAR